MPAGGSPQVFVLALAFPVCWFGGCGFVVLVLAWRCLTLWLGQGPPELGVGVCLLATNCATAMWARFIAKWRPSMLARSVFDCAARAWPATTPALKDAIWHWNLVRSCKGQQAAVPRLCSCLRVPPRGATSTKPTKNPPGSRKTFRLRGRVQRQLRPRRPCPRVAAPKLCCTTRRFQRKCVRGRRGPGKATNCRPSS